MYELLSFGGHPIINNLESILREAYIEKIKSISKVSIKELLEDKVSEKCISLLEGLLSISQSMRYKIELIIKHPWVTQHFNSPIPESPLYRQIKLMKLFKKLGKVNFIMFQYHLGIWSRISTSDLNLEYFNKREISIGKVLEQKYFEDTSLLLKFHLKF